VGTGSQGPSPDQSAGPPASDGKPATVVLPAPHFETWARTDRGRLVQLGFLVAALAVAYFGSQLLSFGAVPRDPSLFAEAFVCLVICVALGLSLAQVAGDPECPRERLAGFAFFSMFVLCAVLSVFPVRFQELQGLPPPRFTLTCLAVAAFPVFVPTSTWKATLFALVSSATQPLALVLFSHAMLSVPALATSVGTALTAAIVAMLGGNLLSRWSEKKQSGRMMGAYRLTRRIEHGPNTETWRAEHHLLARPAALKWVKPRTFDVNSAPHFVRGFEREAQAVAALTSPHTAALFEFGVSQGGVVYNVTELPEGRTLAVAIEDQGPMAPREVLRIALEICDSVAEAHAHGICHGHLSANNVLLCRVGGKRDHVKVLGYGLSQVDPGWGFNGTGLDGLASVHSTATSLASDAMAVGQLIELMATGRYNPSRRERAKVAPQLLAILDRCVSHGFSDVCDLEAALLSLQRRAPHHEVMMSRGPIAALGSTSITLQRSATRQNVMPPGWRGFLTPTDKLAATSSLSQTQLDTARRRLGALVAWVFFGNLVIGAPQALLAPVPWSQEQMSLAGLGAVGLLLDALMFAAVRVPRVPTSTVLGFGLLYACLRTITHTAMAVIIYGMTGAVVQGLTFATLAIVAYPLIVPTPPRRMLPVATTSALATPLFLYALLEPAAPPHLVFESTVIAGVAVGLSYCITTAAFGLNIVSERSRELGSYELLELIGRGAMGEVWRARHQLLARPAALKTIRGDRTLADTNLLSRLWREARITARLTSPHTVRLFDYGVTSNGTCFFAMELLRGIDLQELVERTGPVDPDRAVQIGLDVCDSLSEAHALGLVHRDLKPSNLFQCKVGRRDDLIKVLDFGLARLNRPLGDQSADSSTTIVGTPAYMAPETLIGAPVDPRVDIYALGAVLFFLLTGQHVFEKASAVATVLARLQESAPSIADVSDRLVPPELDALVQRCLERDPEKRFQSIEEVEAALMALPTEVAMPRTAFDVRDGEAFRQH
jgi:serine/threonine-protein kinase